jgi:diguanylate cyclase (GGDEF)-like protein/PAS domain S-box-containing protein
MKSAALRISSIYLLLATGWIWGSDWLVEAWLHAGLPPRAQSWKGTFFVVLTAFMLYGLVRRETRRQARLTTELADREQLLSTFVQHVPAAVALVDRDMRYLLASQRWLSDFGLDEKQVLGQRHGDVFPDAANHWDAAHRDALNGAVTRSEDDQLVRADGRVQHLRWEFRPCKVVNGSVTTVAIFVEDITQFKLDQQRLRSAEERWRYAIDSSDLGLWDWSVPTGTVFFSNRWKTMLGHTPAEIGSGLGEWETRVHPDDMPLVLADVGRLLDGSAPAYSNEHRMRCKDGSYKWILDRGKVIERDDGGNPLRVIGTHTDLTALRLRDAELQLYANLFMHSLEGVMICGPDTNILAINQSFTEITGYSQIEVQGKRPSLLSSGRHDAAFFKELWRQVNALGRWQGEIWNRRKDGSQFLEWLTINVDRDSDGGVRHYYAIFSDITERKATEQRLMHLTHYDALTDLPNRLQLNDRFKRALADAQRHRGTLALLYVDLDRFRHINESLGHSIGDQLLVEVSRRLAQAVGKDDTVSRHGGDEFTVLLPEADADAAAHMAQSLLDALAAPVELSTQQLMVSASIGIATYPADGKDVDALRQASDVAMYRAKQDGGNMYRFHSASMQQQVSKTLQTENALHRALRDQEFELHYQPQIEMSSGRVVGCEALLRWRDPVVGMRSPAEFIPVAEECGLILPIGAWVIRTAAAQCKAWRDGGFGQISVAVNVSALQFRQESFVQQVKQALADSGLPASALDIELTESAVAEDPERATELIQTLHDLGVQLSIDDFGTGYSSLSHLKRFNIHKLKIDQSFVRDLMKDADSASIVQAVISMSANLGLSSIAEGVETAEQAAWLRERGCNEAQGYLFARPMDATAFSRWMAAPPHLAVAGTAPAST